MGLLDSLIAFLTDSRKPGLQDTPDDPILRGSFIETQWKLNKEDLGEDNPYYQKMRAENDPSGLGSTFDEEEQT